MNSDAGLNENMWECTSCTLLGKAPSTGKSFWPKDVRMIKQLEDAAAVFQGNIANR